MRRASISCLSWHFCIMSLQTFFSSSLPSPVPFWLFHSVCYLRQQQKNVVIIIASCSPFLSKSTFDTANKYFCRHTIAVERKEERLVLLWVIRWQFDVSSLLFLIIFIFTLLLRVIRFSFSGLEFPFVSDYFLFALQKKIASLCCILDVREWNNIKTYEGKKVKRKHFIAVSCNIFS